MVCSFLGILINEQNTLIRVPKDERDLVKVSIDTVSGKIEHVSDGDSFTLEDGTEIRLFGIDAPELNQICFLTNEIDNSTTNANVDSSNVDESAGKGILADLMKKEENQNNSTSLLASDSTKKDDVNAITSSEEVKCGEDSKEKLVELTRDRTISCSIKGKDVYGRLVGECYFEIRNKRTSKNNRININKEMVLSGNAVAFVQFSDKYLDDENKAKQENRGIWQTTFDLPSVYRKKNTR